MKHHPKSNNGVFSKAQKKASRMMMMSRSGQVHSQRTYDVTSDLVNGSGLMARALALLVGRQRRP